MEMRKINKGISKKEWDWDNVKKARKSVIKFAIELCPNSDLSEITDLLFWVHDDLQKIDSKQSTKIRKENDERILQEKAKIKGDIILNLFDKYEKEL